MIIEGIKMACEACIRGHRVSGCNHSDRKLLPIAKKGRPVSQCNHCRVARKSRSAHVKCDCGDRLALTKEQAKNGGKPVPSDGGSHAGVAGAATTEDSDSKSLCQCSQGGRCTCALKKEPQHLDAVPELSTPDSCCSTQNSLTSEVPRKPRLQMTQSESSLTTFANGHHKPTHKHHVSMHGSSPYSIPTVGHTGHTFGEHHGCIKAKATTASAPPSVATSKPRRIRSEQSSPDLRSYPALPIPSGITPLELTPPPPPQSGTQPPPEPADVNRGSVGRIQPGLSVNTNHRTFPLRELPSYELLPSADSENGYQFSAGLFPPQSAGWPSSFGQFENNSLDDVLGETNGYESSQFESSQADIDYLMSVPALSNSTSGDEHEDLVLSGNEAVNGVTNGVLSSESSDQSESEQYGLSAASSFIGISQASAITTSTDGGYEEALLATMSMPASVEPFEAGMVAGVDGLFGNDDFGLGSAFTEYPQSTSSDDLNSTAKFTTSVSPPIIPPQPEDSDFLWMAPWSGGAQSFN